MKISKKPTRLKEMLESWKPAQPKLVKQGKARPNAVPIAKPLKPTKDRKLLRFRQAFRMKRPLSETADVDAEIAGTSLIVIDGNRTSAELKDVVDGFAKDCIDLSSDGRTVIAMAVALD
jgi:hypothetical protein